MAIQLVHLAAGAEHPTVPPTRSRCSRCSRAAVIDFLQATGYLTVAAVFGRFATSGIIDTLSRPSGVLLASNAVVGVYVVIDLFALGALVMGIRKICRVFQNVRRACQDPERRALLRT